MTARTYHPEPVDQEWAEFVAQNPILMGNLDDSIEDAEFRPFVGHHSGNLMVASRPVGDDLFAKMHDSWYSDDDVIVHVYEPDEGHGAVIHFGTDAVAAVRTFLDAGILTALYTAEVWR